jgi:hypothetical protein
VDEFQLGTHNFIMKAINTAAFRKPDLSMASQSTRDKEIELLFVDDKTESIENAKKK